MFYVTHEVLNCCDVDCQKIVDVDSQLNQIVLRKPDSSEVPKSFTFDYVYGETSTQQ